jgi:hypothetical protein
MEEEGWRLTLRHSKALGNAKNALQAAAKEVPIVPVRRDKTPLVSWKRYQREKPTQAELERWQTLDPFGFAIVTGSVSRLLVLDGDGAEGAATLARLGLPAHVRTPSGGAHAYVRLPNGAHVRTAGRIDPTRWPALDVRGEGGYAIAFAPGYEWNADRIVRWEELPVELRDAITEPSSRTAGPERLATDLVAETLRRCGAEAIRSVGREVTFRCPHAKDQRKHRRGDLHPSCSINAATGLWHCWSCPAKGNLRSLMVLYGLLTPSEEYQRKTKRAATGSADKIFDQLCTALRVNTYACSYEEKISTLRLLTGLGRSSAKTYLRAAEGKLSIKEKGGKRLNSRIILLLRLALRASKKSLQRSASPVSRRFDLDLQQLFSLAEFRHLNRLIPISSLIGVQKE